MNKNFNVKELARETEKSRASGFFTSWVNVVRLLDNRGFNHWEAEALLCSHAPVRAYEWTCETKKVTAKAFAVYLDQLNITPRCKFINGLVMAYFGKEHGLELNGDGVPCRRGTMPGNPKGGSVLVPLGTPRSCDPTSELYWCM